ncbi:MAG TPA: ATP-binding protein, partial [Steroidobacteraceae bacterium]
QMERALRVLSTELVALEGTAFYQAMTQQLAGLLDCEIVMVARLKPNTKPELETLVVFEDGRSGTELSWHPPMASWTAATLGQTVVTPGGPRDAGAPIELLADQRIIGFAAVPLLDHAGACLGQIAIMSRHALADPSRTEAILKLFALSASAEMERQRSSRRFHDLFEFLPDAIVITDRAGTIRLANAQAETLFGWSRAELAGQGIDVLLPDEGLGQRLLREHLLASENALAKPSNQPDLRARRKDGTVFPVEISLGTIETGDGLMIAAAVRDLTERRNAERRASRARRLESIGTLAGGIAHDLNNALAPILLALDLLKQQYPMEQEALDNVERSANHAVEMVRHLLTYARGSDRKRAPVQLRELLEETEKIVRSSFPKNIEVRLRIPKVLPPVLGNATQLHQVLINLCVNSRDAMPDGGTLTLETYTTSDTPTLADLSGSASGKLIPQGVVVRVSDTGSGIPPEILDRIFDPFFTTKEPDRGTGLGLFTVAGIVKAHEGLIRVSSQPGHGSTFDILLPSLQQAPETVTQPIKVDNFSGHGELILYVDDDTTVRDTARLVLKHLGFAPLTAADGANALKQAIKSRRKLAAVITDLHMPQMDGIAFVRALRNELPELPVVVASGRLEPTATRELRLLGVDVFLEKPFTRDKLSRALQTVLGG